MSTNSTSTSSLVVYPSSNVSNGGTTSGLQIKPVKAKTKPTSSSNSIIDPQPPVSVTAAVAPRETTIEDKPKFGIDFDALMDRFNSNPAATAKQVPKPPMMSALDISQPSPTTIVKVCKVEQVILQRFNFFR